MIPNKPMVFYAVSFYMACISSIAFTDNRLLGAVTAASFLIIIFLTVEKKFSVVIASFFLAGAISTYAYYNIGSIGKVETIRIVKVNEFSCLGSTNGKNIYVKGEVQNLRVGDKILCKGGFEKQLDYQRGTTGVFYVEEYRLYKPDFIARLQDIKRSAYEKFEINLGKENAALVMSMCFGDTAYLDEEQKDSFKELGVVHAISVSGFHMAVIYKVLEGVIGLWPSMIVSLVYMIFTGTQSATLRAFLMILVLKLSKKLFRNYDNLSSLSLSALLILFFRPYFALDAGFVLSYLATLGIILYYNKIKRTLFRLPLVINESLSLTLSAQVFSAAYAGMVFNSISFGFLLGNIILLPMYTALVVAGNAALLLLKSEGLFNIVCGIIKLITLPIDGSSYMLLKLTPPVADISYASSLALLIIILSFILTKKGFLRFKCVPVFALAVVMLQNYYFFPRIDYVSLGGSDGVVISYKSERVLLYNSSQALNEKDRKSFSRVIQNPEGEVVLRLGGSCSITASNGKGYNKNSIDLSVTAHENKTILTRNTEDFMDVDLRKYDIIKMPKLRYYPFKGEITKNTPRDSYTVMLKKVYSLHKD